MRPFAFPLEKALRLRRLQKDRAALEAAQAARLAGLQRERARRLAGEHGAAADEFRRGLEEGRDGRELRAEAARVAILKERARIEARHIDVLRAAEERAREEAARAHQAARALDEIRDRRRREHARAGEREEQKTLDDVRRGEIARTLGAALAGACLAGVAAFWFVQGGAIRGAGPEVPAQARSSPSPGSEPLLRAGWESFRAAQAREALESADRERLLALLRDDLRREAEALKRREQALQEREKQPSPEADRFVQMLRTMAPQAIQAALAPQPDAEVARVLASLDPYKRGKVLEAFLKEPDRGGRIARLMREGEAPK